MKPFSTFLLTTIKSLLNPKTIILIVLFIICLGLGYFIGIFTSIGIFANQNQTASSTSQTTFPPSMVEVVVMLQTVPEGWILSEFELAYDVRSVESVPVNAIQNIEDVVGQPVRFNVFQGLTLTTEMIGPKTYKVLMTTQPVAVGAPITGEVVRYVSVPYDSPYLTTDSITDYDRPWTVDMTAAWNLEENTLLSWSQVTAVEHIEPSDPYLATKSELDNRERLDQDIASGLSQDTVDKIASLVFVDYLIAALLGAIGTAYFIRWRYWRRHEKKAATSLEEPGV